MRARVCANDGIELLTRLAEADARGDDLTQILPGFDPQRFGRLLSRLRGADGSVDPARIAAARERICSMDPARAGRGGGGGPGGPGVPGGNGQREGFAAFRAIACADDGPQRVKDLIARIDAGEDVSGELPGFDPQMAAPFLSRLRAEDGTVSDERIARLRERVCSDEGQGSGAAGPPARGGRPGAGGPPGGFNPLARRSFPGFRYFVSLNHSIELENQILIAPGLAALDQLDGQGTGAFGLPRHTSRLEAGIFGQGMGMRLSGRYLGKASLEGSGAPGTSDLFFDDLATFNLRVFADVGQLVGSDDGVFDNFRISLRVDNVFDGQRRVIDEDGDTPLNYQPFLIDPLGRYVGIDLRKLF